MVFVQKWPFFQIFFLGNIGQENVFYDILEGKNALLAYKNKKFKKSKTLRNRACRYAWLVNANFSVNESCPIICRGKLVKHRYCFGDNRRTKDNRKIKLCGLKACCVTSISWSISPSFPALKRWNESLKLSF